MIWPSPIFWPDTSPAYPPEQQTATVQYESDPELRAEIERLSQEVEALRQEQQGQKQSKVTLISETSSPTVLDFRESHSTATKKLPPTIFILADGERLETQRFVITAGNLSISIHRGERTIPLDMLDINATVAANLERGIDLQVPADRNEIFLSF